MQHYPKTLQFLKEHASALGSRKEGFALALSLLKTPKPVIIETGTTRTPGNWLDGQSTVIFASYAHETRGNLYTVDILPKAIENAKQAVPAAYHHAVEFVVADSVGYFVNYCYQGNYRKVDLFYYDSLDYNETNPKPSQEHCLAEVMNSIGLQLSYPLYFQGLWHKNTVLMFDDADLKDGGKQGLAEKWLAENGWAEIFKAKQSVWIRADRKLFE